jgi:cytochrome c oxidase subunit III
MKAEMNEALKVETKYLKTQNRNHAYTGMVLFIVSEVFLFGSLFWTYYYLRAATPVWPPAGVKPELNLAIVNTVILLLSSLTVWWASGAVQKSNRGAAAVRLGLTIILALAFLGITIYEWTHASFRPWSHAYGSIFYTLTGFHALHVFGGTLLLSSLLARNLRGRLHIFPLEIGSLYWHFVDFIWLIVFVTLFIVR